MADDLALDPNASLYGPELAQAPPAEPTPVPTPAPTPMPPGASRQAGYGPAPTPAPATALSTGPQYGPPAPVRTLGGVDVSRLPFKPSDVDFNDDKEYLDGLRTDHAKVRSTPVQRSGAPVEEATPIQKHPNFGAWDEARKIYEEDLKNKVITDPRVAKDLRSHLEQQYRKMEADTKAEAKKAAETHRLDIRRGDMQRMTPQARAKTIEMMEPYVTAYVDEHTAKAKSGDPATKRQSSYDATVSPLGTMVRKKPDGTMDYSVLRDAATQLMLLNPHITNPEVALRAVAMMGSPIGFDDKTGKAKIGANGVRGKGATSYEVLGHDTVNPENVVVRLNKGPTLAVDPDTLAIIEKARMLGYGAIPKWEEDQAKTFAPGWGEKLMQPFVPKKGF